MEKKKIGLIGFAYSTPSLNLHQENAGYEPYYFSWSPGDGNQDIVVYCEQTMFEPKNDTAKFRIGMLIETMELRPWHYQKAIEHRNEFQMILTHNKSLLSLGHPFAFYPLGGSWLNDWGIHEKSKNVSIIPGHKIEMTGHALRQFVASTYDGSGLVDVFKWGSLPDSKSPALKPYRFSIVVENSQADFWFTEKIVDAFSQGTIPIYWGCPSIKNYFNERGIINFSNVGDLEVILRHLAKDGEKYYFQKKDAIESNLELARKYASLENWLSTSYPNIFT